MLLGRTPECSRLRALLAEAERGCAGTLVLRGEIGIGKTSLLDFAVEAASGFRVLRAAGHEAEAGLSFAGLSWLLDPLTGLLDRLQPAQAAALAGALQLGPAAGGDRLAVAAATLSLLAAAADDAPVLVAVDDAHWLDVSSLEALVFAARRLQAERIAVVLTARPPRETPSDIGRWLGPLPELELGALDERTSWQLVEAHGGGPNRRLLARRIEESAGNPLALLEYPRIGEDASPVTPLPISRRLELAFGAHVRDLPLPTRRAMLLLAAAGAAADDVLLPALDRQGLSPDDLEPAETAGLLVLSGGRIRFRHPLVRSALYQSASPAEQRAAHRMLADVFDGQETPRAAERRGWHLAAATIGPDARVAGELDATAAAAAERRSYATALSLYERAARLSPAGAARARRLLQAAYLSMPAGQVGAGLVLLDEVLEQTGDVRMLTEARHLRCRIEMWRGHPVAARDLLLADAERIEQAEPLWSAYMAAHAALVSVHLGDQRRALAVTARAEKLVSGMDESATMPVLLLRAFALAVSGDLGQARDLLARCGPHLERWDPLDSEQLLLVAALAWESLEEPAAAIRWLRRAVNAAREASAVGLLPFQLSWLALAEFRAGNWTAAYSHGLDAVELASETGWQTELPNSLVALATVEAGLGHAEECRRHLSEAAALAAAGEAAAATAVEARAAAIHGLLELSAGRPAEAGEHLDAAGRFATGRGLGDPVLLNWAGNHVEALVRSGRSEPATRSLEIVSAEAAKTRRPTELAIEARCRGLLAPDPQDAEEAFVAALGWHERAAQPFEEARTRLCHGEVLRRHRRRADARAALERASEQFEQLGARAWADRAHAELRATGATARSRREPSHERLTQQELRVALVVAEGASNAEAAAHLFLSPKTIEYHLSNVYRKLGLRSRGQLARAMGDPAGPLSS